MNELGDVLFSELLAWHALADRAFQFAEAIAADGILTEADRQRIAAFDQRLVDRLAVIRLLVAVGPVDDRGVQ